VEEVEKEQENEIEVEGGEANQENEG